MTYKEAREYLSRAEKKGIVLGLERMRELLVRLGEPQQGQKIVHIAGTNGKGSILSYLEQIFLCGGYRTGRYVSPALGCYEERFLLDGMPMPKEWTVEFTEKIKEASGQMERDGFSSPTVFEMETAMAFLCFQKAKVSVVLLETGMGGRLDATNIIEDPLLSILASVSMDHMAALGGSLLAIAKEKAGIIKKGCQTLLYPGSPGEVVFAVRQECAKKKSVLYEIDPGQIEVTQEREDGSAFSYGSYRDLRISLPGIHQVYNAATALQAAVLLKGWYYIEETAIKEGLFKTRWKARLEKICDSPIVYLDGAHNEDGAAKLAQFLGRHFSDRKIWAVMGVLADKEYDKIAGHVLPLAKKVITVTPKNPRALPGELLQKAALKYCEDAVFAGTPKEGYQMALRKASGQDVVIVFGSLSFMDEIG